MKIIWTKEMDNTLTGLLEEEMSYKDIAKCMSAAFGFEFTKNACIGRARRLRLPPRPPKIIVLPSFIIAVPPKPRKKGEPITILELRDGVCHWPIANVEDRPPYFYCGYPTTDLSCSWCEVHRKTVFGRATSGNARIARPQW